MTTAPLLHVHRSKALQQAELAIAYVLRGGVAASGAMIAFGLSLRIFHLAPVHRRSYAVVAELLSGKISDSTLAPHTWSGFLGGLSSWDPDTLMSLGLLMLIALPVIRVAMTVVLFVIERDLIYFGITLFVLAVLVSGIVFGQAL